MKAKEIIDKGVFLKHDLDFDYSELEMDIYIPIFKRNVRMVAANLPHKGKSKEFDLLVYLINVLIDLSPEALGIIKKEIWKHYNICIKNGEYGMVEYDGFSNFIDANKAFFNLNNEEDTFNASELKLVCFDLDGNEEKFFNLDFGCPWEDEHGIAIAFKDGDFFDTQ